jgi:uncharacterized protein YceK
MNLKILLLLFFIPLFSSGCGTISGHMSGAAQQGIYKGVKLDNVVLTNSSYIIQNVDNNLQRATEGIVYVAVLVDLPFSSIADTILIPFDYYLWYHIENPKVHPN